MNRKMYGEGAAEIVIIDPGDNGEVVYDDVKSLGFEKVAVSTVSVTCFIICL